MTEELLIKIRKESEEQIKGLEAYNEKALSKILKK